MRTLSLLNVHVEDVAIVVNANVTNIDETSFNINWEDLPDLNNDNYIVTVTEVDGTFSQTFFEASTNDIMTVHAEGLTPGTEYNVQIDGLTSTGQRADLSSTNVFTSEPSPLKISLLKRSSMTVSFIL